MGLLLTHTVVQIVLIVLETSSNAQLNQPWRPSEVGASKAPVYSNQSLERQCGQSPIFVHGMRGGGTGIVWNLIQSHPSCAGIGLETNEALAFEWGVYLRRVLRGQKNYLENAKALLKLCRELGVAPSKLAALRDRIHEPLSTAALAELMRDTKFQELVDLHLYNLKMRKLEDPVDKFVFPGQDGEQYSEASLGATRTAMKNNEGYVLLAPFFKGVYPGAQFVSVLRHPLAVCESQRRQGRVKGAGLGEVARRWALYTNTMLEQAASAPSRHMMLTYEGLTEAPWEHLEKMYAFLGLDLGEVKAFSMKIRKYVGKDADGHLAQHQENSKVWMTPEELRAFFKPGINKRVLAALTDAERDEVLRICEQPMKKVGYTEIP
jgi:Sulfotransferase family